MKKDLFSGLFFLIAGFLLLVTIPFSIPYDDQLTQMGPRFFPTFLSLLLALLGLGLCIQAYHQRRKTSEDHEPPFPEAAAPAITIRDEAKVIALYGIMLLSAVLFIFFRYLVAMPLAATAMLVLFNVKDWRYYAVLYLFIALFYFIFVKLMYVQL